MNKSVKSALVALALISALLFLTQPSSGQKQGTIKLQKSTEVKTPKASDKKVVQPSGQALANRPDLAVLPRTDGKQSTAPSTSQTQTSETQTPSSAASCSFTLLLLEEVGEYWLILTAPCPFCTVPSQVTHSNSSILGLSMSPNGPWTESLTVSTTLNGSGQGTSEHFYIKGEAEGTSILHAENVFASFDYEFRVVPCACPTIPIVP